MPKISVLTVTADRKENLKAFLASLIKAKEFEKIEVLILINGPCLTSRDIIKEISYDYKNINFIQSPKQGRGRARNLLLQKARGDVIYFLDDDIVVPQEVFSILFKALEKYPEVDIFGGPNLTPEKSDIFQKAQGFVLSSFFGTLWISRRYRKIGVPTLANERTLILCNLAIRKMAFDDGRLMFNEVLVCAEENVLLQKMARSGHQAMHLPELVVYHERRKNYWQFFRQIFVYGRGRAQAVKCLPQINNIIYFIPALFGVYLTVGLIVQNSRYFFLAYVYMFIVVFNALAISINNRRAILFGILSVLFPTMHLAYGAGFFFELLNNKKALNKNEQVLFDEKAND